MTFSKNYHIADKKFRELLLPTIMMAASNSLITLVDSVIVSRLCGGDRLAAIQITMPLESLLSLIIWTIGIGGSLICFEKKAAGKSREGNQVFTVSLCALLVISALLCAGIALFKEPILTMLCPDAEIRALAGQFLEMQVLTYIPAAYVMGLAYFMRADDRATLAFLILLISNTVNLCMDFVYIQGFGMDIRGASLATLTGYIVACAVTVLYFIRGNCTLRFCFQSCSPAKNLKSIIIRGFPASAISLYEVGRGIVINHVITKLSATALVAFSIFRSSTFIPSILYVGVGQTMLPLVSAFHQEKDYASVRHITRKALLIVAIGAGAFAALIMICPALLIRLFYRGEIMNQDMIMSALRLLPFTYIWVGIVFILTFYLQAIQRLKVSNILSFLDGFAIPSVLMVTLSALFGITGSWIAISFSSFVVLLIYLFYTLKKGNGFFLLSPVERSVLLDVSVPANTKAITDLSESIRNQLLNSDLNGRAHIVALIVEEAAVSILQQCPNVRSIDIALRKTDDQVLVCLRNIGNEFDLLAGYKESPFGNAACIRAVSSNLDYCRITGINCTRITIETALDKAGIS